MAESRENWISLINNFNNDKNSSIGNENYIDNERKNKSKVKKTPKEDIAIHDKRPSICGVCQSSENIVLFCSTNVCLSCKSFFLRYSQITRYIGCIKGANCDVTGRSRLKCKPCRFNKCLDIGLTKSKVTYITTKMNFNLYPCVICSLPSNGYHFGAVTCDACRNFFHKSKKVCHTYVCINMLEVGRCEITHLNHACKFCRYQKCLQNGMANSNIKLGRPSKTQLMINRRRMYDLGIKPAPAKKIELPNENKVENKPPFVVLLLPNNSNSGSLISQSTLKSSDISNNCLKNAPSSTCKINSKPMSVKQIIKNVKLLKKTPKNKNFSKRSQKKLKNKREKKGIVEDDNQLYPDYFKDEETLDLDYNDDNYNASFNQSDYGDKNDSDSNFSDRETNNMNKKVKNKKQVKSPLKLKKKVEEKDPKLVIDCQSETPSKTVLPAILPKFTFFSNFNINNQNNNISDQLNNKDLVNSDNIKIKMEPSQQIIHFQNNANENIISPNSGMQIIYIPQNKDNLNTDNLAKSTFEQQTLANFFSQNFIQNKDEEGKSSSNQAGPLKIGQMGPIIIGQSGITNNPIQIGQTGPIIIGQNTQTDQMGQLKIGQNGSNSNPQTSCGQNLIASILSSDKNKNGRMLSKIAEQVEKPQAEILADAYNSILTQIQFQSTPKRILPKTMPPIQQGPVKRERFLMSSKYLNKNEEKCFVCETRKASGYHFGVVSCNACMKFFRKSLDEHINYKCDNGSQNCDITVTGVSICKFCRYQKCQILGMTQKGKKVGRPTLDRISKLRSTFNERCKNIAQTSIVNDLGVTNISSTTTTESLPLVTSQIPSIVNFNQNNYSFNQPSLMNCAIDNNLVMNNLSMDPGISQNKNFTQFCNPMGNLNPVATSWLDQGPHNNVAKDFITLDTVAKRQVCMSAATRRYTSSVSNGLNMDFIDYLDNVQEVVEVEVGDLQVD